MVENPDSVHTDFGLSRTGRQMVAYIKRYDDGVIVYVQEVNNKRKDLAALSMRKYPTTSNADNIIKTLRDTLHVQNDGKHDDSIDNDQTLFQSKKSSEQSEAQRQLDEQLVVADRMIAERGGLFAPNGQPSKLNRVQWAQVRTANFKAWFGDWETGVASKVLNGDPVATVSKSSVPDGGIAQVTQWAKGIFKAWDNKAMSPLLGEVDLSNNSVSDSMYHGRSKAKFAAFAAVKQVIEQGVVLSGATRQAIGRTDYFVSAPIKIDGSDEVVTVHIKRAADNQRMYLHSVTMKERLLTPHAEKQFFVADTVSASEAAQPKTTSADIHNILHDYLVFNPDSVSKVVDENGEPMVVFHGTPSDVSAFDEKKYHSKH